MDLSLNPFTSVTTGSIQDLSSSEQMSPDSFQMWLFFIPLTSCQGPSWCLHWMSWRSCSALTSIQPARGGHNAPGDSLAQSGVKVNWQMHFAFSLQAEFLDIFHESSEGPVRSSTKHWFNKAFFYWILLLLCFTFILPLPCSLGKSLPKYSTVPKRLSRDLLPGQHMLRYGWHILWLREKLHHWEWGRR